MTKILIIGKVPPPIGGVSIHTSRLIEHLNLENIDYVFYNNNNFNLFSFLKVILFSKKAHIHLNNPFFLFSFVLICRLFNTYSLITIHGNIASYGKITTFFEKLAIRISNLPIVLNQRSYSIAIKINSNSKLMSAFIPPIITEILEDRLQLKIDSIKATADYIFCTNAHSLVYDKNGNEIYGIFPLINYFNHNPKIGLILSDPKGEYQNFFISNNSIVNDNIIILNKNHSFFEVIKQSDCFIRNTTTDGDSLSINEALYLGRKVIATSCVNRSEGVLVFGDKTDLNLASAIDAALYCKIASSEKKPINAAFELVKLYNN
jgi:glycosyltransferase involved in cell wall biosynthesis